MTVLQVLILVSLWAGIPGPAWGNPAHAVLDDESAAVPPGPTDHHELEVFLDQFFARTMEEKHIPGAAIVVVKDGQVFLSKGYGYADRESKTPVDPEKTLFRIGSISKLFTAVAVLQLAEQGKIDLQADINTYLKRFQVENRYAQPITVAQLLTHTHGLDVSGYIGWFTRDASQLKPLDDFLADDVPPQVEPPGEAYLYSNVGMTLVGFIVEEVTGMPFVQYAEEYILGPLGMAHSSFAQPLPPALMDDLAVGYEYLEGTYRPWSFVYCNSIPASAMSATAADMARFLMAMLQHGRYGDTWILGEAAAREMFRRQFAHHSLMPGTSYGLYEAYRNNLRTLQHGGIIPGFINLVSFFPDQNLAFYAAGNQVGEDYSVFERLADALIDRYYAPNAPNEISPVQTSASLPADSTIVTDVALDRYAGNYRDENHPRHSIIKLGILQGWRAEAIVKAGRDGTLVLYPENSRWMPVEPLLFRQVGDPERYLVFQQDEQGHITHMITDEGIIRYARLPWYTTTRFQQRWVKLFALGFATVPVLWSLLVAYQMYRRRKVAQPAAMKRWDLVREGQWTKLVAVLICVLNLVFLVGIFWVFLTSGEWTFAFGMPESASILFTVPLLTTGMALVLLVGIGVAWKRRYWPLVDRVYYTLVLVGTVAFIPFLSYWNLLTL